MRFFRTVIEHLLTKTVCNSWACCFCSDVVLDADASRRGFLVEAENLDATIWPHASWLGISLACLGQTQMPTAKWVSKLNFTLLSKNIDRFGDESFFQTTDYTGTDKTQNIQEKCTKHTHTHTHIKAKFYTKITNFYTKNGYNENSKTITYRKLKPNPMYVQL